MLCLSILLEYLVAQLARSRSGLWYFHNIDLMGGEMGENGEIIGVRDGI